MNLEEMRAIENEPRIFKVVEIDDEGNTWTIWERRPRGFDEDQSLRGWTVERRVCFHSADGGYAYGEMELGEFLEKGLPGD